MATAYEWVEGHKLAVDATKLGRAVERVARQNGGICSPAAYVDAARDETHIFHKTVEWDDFVAAEAHRRQQARQILTHLRVVGGNPDLPAFIHVRVEDAEGYVASHEVEANVEYHAFALAEAAARLKSVRRRYAALEELAPVWQAIDELEAVAA